MKIPDICNVLSSSGKEFSLSHWYSPIIDSLVAKIEVQRKHLFQIFRIYWIDSLFNMQVFWDLRMQWSNCPYFVAKKDLHWIYLVEKGKSGYSCQDAKFRSTPNLVICVAYGAICHCLPCHMPFNRCYITLHALLHIRAMQCALPCYMPSCYCLPCYISPPCNMQVAGGRHSLRRIATAMPFTKSGKPTKKKSYIGKSMDQSRIVDQWKFGQNLQIWNKYQT